MDGFSDRGSTPLTSTIVEPVEPHGLAGFSLCSKIGGVDDMPVSDRYSFPKRQTEIPTDLFSEVVGIIVLCILIVLMRVLTISPDGAPTNGQNEIYPKSRRA